MMYEQQNYYRCRCTLRKAFCECHLASSFGEILKRARLEANFPSPEALSRGLYLRCGVKYSSRSIYRYESGDCTPSLNFLVAVSLVLKPEIFSDLLTDVLSPSLIGSFKTTQDAILCDRSKQMKLFR
ncbi:MAG: helix-turn-helix domain-containing protein [Coriobacteriia bacterium]|nr:helix-turn-helix domain-containing protein [Coriobacteriia bacterium]